MGEVGYVLLQCKWQQIIVFVPVPGHTSSKLLFFFYYTLVQLTNPRLNMYCVDLFCRQWDNTILVLLNFLECA